MEQTTVEREIGGRTFSLSTGYLAKQASGAVVVQYGETVVFVAAQTGPPRPGIDFFPLTCDYRERFAAAGKFPGGFLKREGRPSTREILTARLTDRPIRPLFPKGYNDEVQLVSNALAYDGENDPDVLSINGASAALMISPAPFQGPIAAVRVGMVDDELVLFPTREELKEGTLDLIVAGSKESVLMIEGFGNQIPEDVMADAIMFAHEAVVDLCGLQEELVAALNLPAKEFPEAEENPFLGIVREKAYGRIREAKVGKSKAERYAAIDAIRAELIEEFFPNGATETEDGKTVGQLKQAVYKTDHQAIRDLLLEGKRLDGRELGALRHVESEVGIIPRIHGSAVFTRGETQAVAQITLGTARDTQRVDGPVEEFEKRFMLDYNFPSYSVGECRPIRGPGRREIGHGMLAERSVAWVLPTAEKFPYTIRMISDITESNGSSSMASVCSGTLALMDAGVPISQPVAGISIGLIKEGDKWQLLTDIMGDEDHHGDMDFKIAGTGKGITGIQLDLKIDGISEDIIRATLEQGRNARRDLLRIMLQAISRPRKEISQYAPRLLQTKIDPEKIGLLIGPGGKTIRAMQEETGTQIDINNDGTVTIAAAQASGAEEALARIEAMTEEVKVGRTYKGKVSSVKDFGAFIEIAPGKDGLCHISELSDGFVKNVSDICKVGDELEVKVIAVDDQNRVKLSRKAVLAEQAPAAGNSDDGDSDEGDSDEGDSSEG
ncbi:MAG: polyribonucleotide nucleotidyltransferase [Planctomycetota bacterium]|nr:polyribonucleotide nucleotidyltransferase [Planctomycetota bacterium]MDA1249397.1 polyribonucleotide nucleotidyltransferase [Planctomycetota bacterium]